LTNIQAVYEDIFRCLSDPPKPMELSRSVAGALSGHLADPTTSKAPHLDGTAAVPAGSDDPGLWQIDNPSIERMQELERMLAAEQLPGFGRLHLL
jgi:hypothetical protein